MNPRTRFTIASILVVSFLLLSVGCTPEKAKALRLAAVQFKLEALAAIDSLETLMREEIEPPPRTDFAVSEEFVKNIMSLDSSTEVTAEVIESALDPYEVNPGPEYEIRKKAFLGRMRNEYIAFAGIFDDLERGSLLAVDAVAASAPHVKNLTIQMAALAQSISEHPPKLLQYRSAIIDEIENVRVDGTLPAEQMRLRMIELKDKWIGVKVKESELQRSAVESCLKAAILGMEVRRLIDAYAKLSLDDLNFVISKLLEEAGSVSGRNLEELKAKSKEIFAKLENDPIWSDVSDSVLREVNEAIVVNYGGTE